MLTSLFSSVLHVQLQWHKNTKKHYRCTCSGLLNAELTQKLVSLKHNFNRLHVISSPTKGNICDQQHQTKVYKSLRSSKTLAVLAPKSWSNCVQMQLKVNKSNVVLRKSLFICVVILYISNRSDNQPQPLIITNVTLTIPACTRYCKMCLHFVTPIQLLMFSKSNIGKWGKSHVDDCSWVGICANHAAVHHAVMMKNRRVKRSAFGLAQV